MNFLHIALQRMSASQVAAGRGASWAQLDTIASFQTTLGTAGHNRIPSSVTKGSRTGAFTGMV